MRSGAFTVNQLEYNENNRNLYEKKEATKTLAYQNKIELFNRQSVHSEQPSTQQLYRLCVFSVLDSEQSITRNILLFEFLEKMKL